MGVDVKRAEPVVAKPKEVVLISEGGSQNRVEVKRKQYVDDWFGIDYVFGNVFPKSEQHNPIGNCSVHDGDLRAFAHGILELLGDE